jgi:DNA uptake protein ComE-like DNA-binding protein
MGGPQLGHESGGIVPEAEGEVSRWNFRPGQAFYACSMGISRMIQTQKNKTEPRLDKEIEGTFPASDPPSFMGSTAIAGAPKDHAAQDNGAKPTVVKDRLSIDLNRATKEQLGALSALGPDQVRAIVASRPFHSWEDLKGLPDFDGKTIAALKKGGAHIAG